MASALGHAIAGGAVGLAAGWPWRWSAVLALAAAAPDLDLLLGLALRGDSQAFHQHWLSHSPLAALLGAALAALLLLPWHHSLPRGYILRLSLLVGAAILTHPLLDYALLNPFFVFFGDPWGAATDLPFYGGLAWLFLRIRRMGHPTKS